MKKVITNKYFLTFAGIGLFFLLWLILYFIGGQTRAIFPNPVETFEEMFIYLQDPYTYLCIGGTLGRMMIGFTIGAVTALILGMIVGNVRQLKYVFNPTIVALKAVPTAALVFLFLILAGLKNAPIYIVVIIVFPLVYEATVAGYANLDRDVLMSARVDGGSSIKTNFRIKFPLAFPTIAVGLISSFALSLKIEIMAEVISGSSSYGLGRAIQNAYINSSKGLVPTFAYSLIAILLMLIITALLDILKKIFKLKSLSN